MSRKKPRTIATPPRRTARDLANVRDHSAIGWRPNRAGAFTDCAARDPRGQPWRCSATAGSVLIDPGAGGSPLVRFTVAPPGGPFFFTVGGSPLRCRPDGQSLAFVATVEGSGTFGSVFAGSSRGPSGN